MPHLLAASKTCRGIVLCLGRDMGGDQESPPVLSRLKDVEVVGLSEPCQGKLLVRIMERSESWGAGVSVASLTPGKAWESSSVAFRRC